MTGSEHVVDALSAYLDEELPSAEKESVETHLSSCADCRAELATLREVSGMLRSLPEKPLPVGFRQRLENRRARGSSDAAGGWMLPFPARVVAFALSSLIVTVVVYDRARLRLPITGGTPGFTADESRLPSRALYDMEKDGPVKDFKGRVIASAPGMPLFGAAVETKKNDKSSQEESLARENAPAPAQEPAGGNDALIANLESAKRKKGMRALAKASRPPMPADTGSTDGALSLSAARAPVPLDGAAGAPQLLKSEAEKAAAAALPSSKLSNGAPVDQVGADAPAAVVSGFVAQSSAVAKAEGAASGGSAADVSAPAAGNAAPAGTTAPAAPAPAAAAAPAAAPGVTEGLVLNSEEERRQAWAERGLHSSPPTVNYARNRVALVVAPDMKTAVEVMGVSTQADRVVVKYRLFPRLEELAGAARRAGAPVRSYQFRVIPAGQKPVVFVQTKD